MASRIFGPFAALLALGLASACGPAEAPPAAQALQPAAGAAAAQTPAAIRYAGTLPCADCAGIRMELTLNRDAASGEPTTYELKETYLGSMAPEAKKPFTQTGRWSIRQGSATNPSATVYLLDGGGDPKRERRFERVGEQEVVMLDREQRRPESSHSYSLTRLPDVTLSFGTPVPPGAGPAGSGPEVTPGAMVTDLASGWPVTLQMGQELTARLTADRAAGFEWRLRPGSEGGIVVPQGKPDYEAPSGAPGGNGVEVFRFKAVKPGTTTLAFDYKRAGEATPAKSATYNVTVQ